MLITNIPHRLYTWFCVSLVAVAITSLLNEKLMGFIYLIYSRLLHWHWHLPIRWMNIFHLLFLRVIFSILSDRCRLYFSNALIGEECVVVLEWILLINKITTSPYKIIFTGRWNDIKLSAWNFQFDCFLYQRQIRNIQFSPYLTVLHVIKYWLSRAVDWLVVIAERWIEKRYENPTNCMRSNSVWKTHRQAHVAHY